MEDKAAAALAMPVRIGTLEGRWQGFAPVLIAHDLQVGEGPGALQLDQVRVVPDVLASLAARQLRVARLELEGLHLLVDVLCNLKANRWAKASTQQLFFERYKQVLALILVNLEILIAGNAEGVVLQHFHAREKLTEELADDVFQWYESNILDSGVPWDANKARQ